MVDDHDSKSCGLRPWRFESSLAHKMEKVNRDYRGNLAYIIGIALGDGNLSNPNGRAVRLRVTCDTKYPKIIKHIIKSIRIILPNNRVSIIKRATNYVDISCYSNKWPQMLGWNVGAKYEQQVSVTSWIKKDKIFAKLCLLGLLQTDGSIYNDRGYKMVNFVSTIRPLAQDAKTLISILGFNSQLYTIKQFRKKTRYNLRISKNVNNFIKTVSFTK